MESPPELVPSSPRAVRGRTSHACDRCRLKKAKCNGSKPCDRCKAYDVVCIFNDKKKVRQKSHPPGYVELLEVQQSQLIFGLQELFRMVEERKEWDRPPPRRTTAGFPLVHDILDALGAFEETDLSPTLCSDEDSGNFQDTLFRADPQLTRSNLLSDHNFQIGDDNETVQLASQAEEQDSTLPDFLSNDTLPVNSLDDQSFTLPGVYVHPQDQKLDRDMLATGAQLHANATSVLSIDQTQVRVPGVSAKPGLVEPNINVVNRTSSHDWTLPTSAQHLSGNIGSVAGLNVHMDCLWPAKCPMVHLMALNKQLGIDPASLLPNLLSTPQTSETISPD